jgi:hypothetical protein
MWIISLVQSNPCNLARCYVHVNIHEGFYLGLLLSEIRTCRRIEWLILPLLPPIPSSHLLDQLLLPIILLNSVSHSAYCFLVSLRQLISILRDIEVKLNCVKLIYLGREGALT